MTAAPKRSPFRSALIQRLVPAVVGFVFAFLPALRVARHVELAALAGIGVVLALQAEDGVAEAQVVPVGIRAGALVHSRAAVKQDEQDRPVPHTRPTPRAGPYSWNQAFLISMPAARQRSRWMRVTRSTSPLAGKRS